MEPPVGSRLYIPNRDTANVPALDMTASPSAFPINVPIGSTGGEATGVAVYPAGTHGCVSRFTAALSVVDTITHTVLATVSLPGTGNPSRSP